LLHGNKIAAGVQAITSQPEEGTPVFREKAKGHDFTIQRKQEKYFLAGHIDT